MPLKPKRGHIDKAIHCPEQLCGVGYRSDKSCSLASNQLNINIYIFFNGSFFLLKKYLVEINSWRENRTTKLVILTQFL